MFLSQALRVVDVSRDEIVAQFVVFPLGVLVLIAVFVWTQRL